MTVCLIASCCSPGILLGLAKGKVDGNAFDINSCCCSGIGAYRLRKYVQNTYGIQEDDDASMCGVACCSALVVCQDVAELQRRGAISLLGGEAKTVQPANPDAPKA
ncbi:MAG: hypothetical protein SGCHY_005113 [Lobulomycetales sp.]